MNSSSPRARRWIALLLMCGTTSPAWASGNATQENPPRAAVWTYRPENVHQVAKTLPATLRRVAVLPLVSDSTYDLTEGCDSLSPILFEELLKTKKFEAVKVDPDALRRATGKAAWTGEERLPVNLLSWLTNTYGCDAILIPQLTVFRGYAPLAVGWRFKLIDAQTGAILWCTDEVFDAAQPSIASGAKRYNRRDPAVKWNDDGWTVLRSPRRFGRYSAATLLTLLPER